MEENRSWCRLLDFQLKLIHSRETNTELEAHIGHLLSVREKLEQEKGQDRDKTLSLELHGEEVHVALLRLQQDQELAKQKELSSDLKLMEQVITRVKLDGKRLHQAVENLESQIEATKTAIAAAVKERETVCSSIELVRAKSKELQVVIDRLSADVGRERSLRGTLKKRQTDIQVAHAELELQHVMHARKSECLRNQIDELRKKLFESRNVRKEKFCELRMRLQEVNRLNVRICRMKKK